ncbi:MAG: hypothetical protein ACI81L_003259 [Verrucomicrobiales bacterium]|jgi:hypothetical protein
MGSHPHKKPQNLGRTLAAILLLSALVATAFANDLVTPTTQEPFDAEFFDPTDTDEERPDRYRETLPRDAIYNPEFVQANEIEWLDQELVIGVNIGRFGSGREFGLLG